MPLGMGRLFKMADMPRSSENAVHGNKENLYWYKSECRLGSGAEKRYLVRLCASKLHSSN